MDYTVIVHVRQQFGNEDLDIGVFAGREKEFTFNCPNVGSGQTAMLLFQGQRVGQEHTLEINGSDISGGIPSGPIVANRTSPAGEDFHSHTFGSLSFGWSGYVMLVGPNILKPSNNVMRVAARDNAEFVIDNVVVVYKTASDANLEHPQLPIDGS